MSFFDPITIGKVLTPKYVVAARKIINGIGRPIITMSDKNTPEDAKRYAAAREFSTEMVGLGIILTVGTLFERVGGKLYAQHITKKPFSMAQFKALENKSLTSLSGKNEQKIKAAILVFSFISTIIEGAILTPLLNNIILHRYMDKIFQKDCNKSEITKSAFNQKKLSFKEKNIFNSCSTYIEGKNI